MLDNSTDCYAELDSMTSVSNADNCPVGTTGDYYSRYVI
jgi:hypothetical protein